MLRFLLRNKGMNTLTVKFKLIESFYLNRLIYQYLNFKLKHLIFPTPSDCAIKTNIHDLFEKGISRQYNKTKKECNEREIMKTFRVSVECEERKIFLFYGMPCNMICDDTALGLLL